MVPLYQLPPAKQAAEGKRLSSGLCHRCDFCRKDFFEKIQCSVRIKILVWFIIVKIRLARVFQIFGIVFVQFDDFFDERLVTRKIRTVQETARSLMSGSPQ
jgi:hypothetical protein